MLSLRKFQIAQSGVNTTYVNTRRKSQADISNTEIRANEISCYND